LESAKKDSGVWKQITYKRTVDKTSQALREKETLAQQKEGSGGIGCPAPVVDTSGMKQAEAAVAAAAAAARKGNKKDCNLSDLTQATLKQAGLIGDAGGAQQQQQPQPQIMNLPGMGMPQQPGMDFDKKRKQAAPPQANNNNFVKPSWWNRGGTPVGNNSSNPNKKIKVEQQEDPAPLPPEPLEVRQSSLFRFLNNTNIFGRSNQQQIPMQQSSSMFGFSTGNNNSVGQNPGDMISAEAAHFEQRRRNSQRLSLLMQQQQQQQQQLQQSMAESNNFMLDPLPLNMNGGGTNQQQGNINSNRNNDRFSFSQQGQMPREMMQPQQAQEQGQGGMSVVGLNNHRSSNNNYPLGAMEEMPMTGLFPSGMGNNNVPVYPPVYPSVAAALGGDDDAPLPVRHLTTQVSDWLTSFFPLGKDGQPDESPPPPPPPGDDLERSVSSTLFNLVRSPSQFLTNLKSGVTSMFGEAPIAPLPQGYNDPNDPNNSGQINNAAATAGGGPMMGMGGTETKQSSLLDDYEESALEARLRSVSSRR
jgi:hypothetical protein